MNTATLDHPGRVGRPHTQRPPPAEADAAQPAITPTLQPAANVEADIRRPHTAVMRTALVLGSVVAAGVAWLAASGGAQPSDAELATLLRGMAAIKGLLAVAAAGLLWWRLGQPVATRVAVTYIACAWALFAATLLIWQLAFIVTGAASFHAAGIVGLVLALREGRRLPGPVARSA